VDTWSSPRPCGRGSLFGPNGLNRHRPKPAHESTVSQLCSGQTPRRVLAPLAASWSALAADVRVPRPPERGAGRTQSTPGLTFAQSVAAPEDDSRLQIRSHLLRETRSASDATIGVSRESRISVAAVELLPKLRVRPPSPEGDDRTHPGATTGVIPAHEVAVLELPPLPGPAPHPPERGCCTSPNHNRRDSRTRRGCSGVSSFAQNLPDVLPREATAHVQAPRQA